VALAGKSDPDPRRPSLPVFHAGGNAMELGESLDQRQADPDAAPSALALPERFEDLLLDLVRHTGPLVLHDDHDTVAFLDNEDLDRRARWGVAGRVVEQVLDDPLDLRV